MDDEIQNIIRNYSSPLEPRPMGESPVLKALPGIRAVLFDVYGTLFVSASGEVGTVRATEHGEAFRDALEAVDTPLKCAGEKGVARLDDVIHDAHQASRQEGIENPEVDIVAVWARVLGSLFRSRLISHAFFTEEYLQELAVRYEVRANPVWPMPGCAECLAALDEAGLLLGIVSNAQFFTPALFPALLGHDLTSLGFHPQLLFYSYCYGQAKPGRFLFERSQEALATLGVAADEVLYIGNDMLNDIRPAGEVGFHTALFAGDERSLRLRNEDQRVAGVTPDLVLTHLDQLPQCVLAGR